MRRQHLLDFVVRAWLVALGFVLVSACVIRAALLPGSTTSDSKLRDSYDVVIAGAGTGGFGAAVQAARLGMTVLLLEETDWIGGQMTAAAVTSMDEGPRHPDRSYVLVRERGIYREFTDEVTAHYENLGISPETAYWGGHICMEPRVGQEILYKMLNNARRHTAALDVSLRSKVMEVFKQANTVTGVLLEIQTQPGKVTKRVGARILVDATEWGDVIPLTGARYRAGNCLSGAIDPNRAIQDITWTAVIKQYPKGVPPDLVMTEAPPGYEQVHTNFVKSLVAGDKIDTKVRPWTFATFIGYRAMPNSEQPGVPRITRTHLNFNNDYPTRIADLEDPNIRHQTGCAATLKTLNLLYYIQHTLGKTDWSVADDEGFDSPYNRTQVNQWITEEPRLKPYRSILNHFSVMPYARESRRIIGLHTLAASEIERKPRSPRMFEDTVALGDYAVDLHGSKKPELLELDLDHLEDIPREIFGQKGTGPFAIPFGCFIPEKLDGFLASEKNISQSRLANGATRLQPSTMLIGQAAGVIAALSVQHGLPSRALDPVLVQKALLEVGATLQITPLKDVSKSGWEWSAIQLVTVRGLMTLEQGRFRPEAPLTREALELILKRLFNHDLGDDAAVARAGFARLLQKEMSTAGVKLAPEGVQQPGALVSRLECAQVIAGFLEKRALAKLTGRDQVLSWPPLRGPSALKPEDLPNQPGATLARDLGKLVELHVIDSPDYWLSHANGTGICDGELVATLLRSCASKLQPGSDPAAAIQVCATAGLIGSADYWTKNAVAGRKCSGAFVATVIQRAARQIKAQNTGR